MKKRAGRPKLDPAYRLRTRAWFNAVSQASGMNDCEMEVYFGNSKYTALNRPGLWGKYKKGTICPKSNPDINGRPSIVERAEEAFPGTAQWLKMPFWDVLSRRRMEMSEIKQIYFKLPGEIFEKIVVDELDEEFYDATFWRLPTDWMALFSELSEIGTLDAATAILALIKECETAQRQEEHKIGLTFWGKIALKLHQYPPLAPLVIDINSIIGKYYIATYYPTSYGEYEELDTSTIAEALKGNSF